MKLLVFARLVMLASAAVSAACKVCSVKQCGLLTHGLCSAQGGDVPPQQEIEQEQYLSTLPFLPPLTDKTMKTYYAFYGVFFMSVIIFGGVLAPLLELKLGVGGAFGGAPVVDVGAWCLHQPGEEARAATAAVPAAAAAAAAAAVATLLYRVAHTNHTCSGHVTQSNGPGAMTKSCTQVHAWMHSGCARLLTPLLLCCCPSCRYLIP